MNTTNLKELRELRNQEKAIKARIDEISTEATNEAVAILAENGLEKGEFEVEGIGKFQLQRTEIFDFADYHKYQQEQAVKWRENAKEDIDEDSFYNERAPEEYDEAMGLFGTLADQGDVECLRILRAEGIRKI